MLMSPEVMDGYELFNSDTELGKALRENLPGNIKTIDIHIEEGNLVTVTTTEIMADGIIKAKTWGSILSNLQLQQSE